MKSAFVFAAAIILFTTSVFGAIGDMGLRTEPLTDGSVDYPYLIEDIVDFDLFANGSAYWAAGVNTRLMCNINLIGRVYTTAVIAPDINEDSDNHQGPFFNGIFDGAGHVIYNLVINNPGKDIWCLGLFGKIEGGVALVENLGVENLLISSGPDSVAIGGLCGQMGNYNSRSEKITNCYITGSITGSRCVGGLCGINFLGRMSGCHAICTVKGSSAVGGLCGHNSKGGIYNSYSSGYVEGGVGSWSIGGLCGNSDGNIAYSYSRSVVTSGDDSENVGGLCGNNDHAHIGTSCAWGSVQVGDNSRSIGGLCGKNMEGSVSNSYATGSVKGGDGSSRLGGLIGWTWNGDISRCYSTGSVEGSVELAELTDIGGFCGRAYSAHVYSSYWDVEASGVGSEGDGNIGAIGKTSIQMKDETTFYSWDFSGLWNICDGLSYPRLYWEIPDGDFVCPYGVDLQDFSYFSQRYLTDGCGGVFGDEGGFVNLGSLALMGEYWLKEQCGSCNGADVSNDGNVNTDDIKILAEQWLCSVPENWDRVDLDSNGVVNVFDLRIFCESWLANSQSKLDN